MTSSILSKSNKLAALLPTTVCLAVTLLGCSSSTSTSGRVDAGDLGGGGGGAGMAGAGGITGSGGRSSAGATSEIAVDASIDTSTGSGDASGTGGATGIAADASVDASTDGGGLSGAGGATGIAVDAGVDAPAGETTSGLVDAQPTTYTVSGVAQKGPFGNGTNVNIAECDDSLVPTGRTFSTSIVDNTGLFSLPNVQLSGKYVRLMADGFYFDEVANQLSVSGLALNAVADLTNRPTVNVNLLTHLEQPRLDYLLAQGSTFADAKTQAQREVLAIFGFTLSSPALSETLDIARGTDDDAILLAASVILQGHRTPGKLTELLSNIGTDIRTDGVLDSTESGSALMNGAVLLSLAAVRSNLEGRYATLGVTATIGDFEKYVQAFISSAKYQFTDVIVYPATGTRGLNLLDPARTDYPHAWGTFPQFSFRADLPPGTSLDVVVSNGSWSPGTESCWEIGSSAQGRGAYFMRMHTSANAQSCDLEFLFINGSCVRVDYYENFELFGTATPTRSKVACTEVADGGQSSVDGDTDAPADGGIDVPSDTAGTADAGEGADG
jgi:hypothetical protein